MNTWRDDVQLVKIVTKYLTYLILLFDNCTNSDFSWEEITGESKLENKDVFGNETEIMVELLNISLLVSVIKTES
jgi:hypothetical protein